MAQGPLRGDQVVATLLLVAVVGAFVFAVGAMAPLILEPIRALVGGIIAHVVPVVVVLVVVLAVGLVIKAAQNGREPTS